MRRFGERTRVSTRVDRWIPAPAFNPSLLSLKLWLDASDATTITASSGKVSQWSDKSGNGFHFVQATGSAQPTTGASTQNGFNVIDFDGNVWLQYNTASDFLFTVDGTKYIIAAAWKAGTSTNPNTNYTLIGSSNTVSQTGFYVMFDDRSSQSRNETIVTAIFNGGVSTVLLNVAGNSSHPPATPLAFTALLDPSNATAAERSAMGVGTGYVIKNNTNTGTPPTTVTNGMRVGGNVVGNLVGFIAEIIIVSGTDATETNRIALRDYLIQKWAL